mmetsp:Transcript_6652/g.14557  ORF Transcript_6652/g.14557 Transcript_6652/m.14557 type:complete len:362 (-) Transcript_6652:59-1144(-)
MTDSLTGGDALPPSAITRGAASASATAADDFPLRAGDLVLVASPFWADSQNFVHFMRRQSGSTIPLSKGAVLRVVDVIRASGDFVLSLANLFDDDETDQTRQLLGEESMIFCSEGDVEKLEVIQRRQDDIFDAVDQHQQQQQSTEDQEGDGDDEGSERDEEEDPIMLMDCAPYMDIIGTLTAANRLPMDLAEHSASFLQVETIDVSEVAVTRASSTRGDFPLSSVIGNDDGTWWISAEGTMKNGRGEEFIEFSLSPDGTARRCSYIGISIPPLPQGPLSVRRFRVDWSYDGQEWITGCRRYTMETMDMAGMQSFKLERPIDAAKARLVCLTNAYARREQDRRGRGGSSPFQCVGLFFVRWK